MKGIGNEVNESLTSFPNDDDEDENALKKTRMTLLFNKIVKKVNEMSWKVFPYKDAAQM